MNRKQRMAMRRRADYERKRNLARNRPKTERGVQMSGRNKVLGARVEVMQRNAIKGTK